MIAVGDHVLWSYIHPVDDTDHHACVMIRRDGAEPEVLIRSEFPASDFILDNIGEDIYILERRHVAAEGSNRYRLLKMRPGEEPMEIWPWMPDDIGIGYGGFAMVSDEEMILASYPDILCLGRDGASARHFVFNEPVKRIRRVDGGNLLLLGDKSCWLTDRNGNILQSWHDLTDDKVEGAPLNRNMVFDADYRDGKLVIAYWGKRTFESLTENEGRKIILEYSDPVTPHWVACFGSDLLLFASKLVFDGSTPKPLLVRVGADGGVSTLWEM